MVQLLNQAPAEHTLHKLARLMLQKLVDSEPMSTKYFGLIHVESNKHVFQTCSATQTCCAGACIDSCTPNASQKCVGNSVYNFDSCGTQGTLVTACTSTQTCTNSGSTASCVNQNIACTTNAQCGTNGLTGNLFCKTGNVYQSYQTWTCNNAGTPTSSCTAALSDQLVTTCSINQTCNTATATCVSPTPTPTPTPTPA